MSSDTPTFKVLVFASDLEFLIEVNEDDITTQILLTIMESIDHSLGCKLNTYVIAHTKEKQYLTN